MVGQTFEELTLSGYNSTFDVIAYGANDDDPAYRVIASFDTYDDARAYADDDANAHRSIVTVQPPREWIRAVARYMNDAVRY